MYKFIKYFKILKLIRVIKLVLKMEKNNTVVYTLLYSIKLALYSVSKYLNGLKRKI